MRKETVSLGDMVTVHELEWLPMASGVFVCAIRPCPCSSCDRPFAPVSDCLQLSGFQRQGWNGDHRGA